MLTESRSSSVPAIPHYFRGPVLLCGLLSFCQLLIAQHHEGPSTAHPVPASGATATSAARELDTVDLAAQVAAISNDEAGSTTGSASTNDSGVAGVIPFTPGFNASLATLSQHDSTDGWSSLLTPDLAYRFNRHYSINVEVPVFAYLNVSTSQTVTTKGVTTTTYSYATRNFLLGDTTLSGQFEAHPRFFDYNVTTTLGMPTGDDANGLGAGQPTYEINNHLEHPFRGYITPELELGIGDSASLTDMRLRKSYTVVGTNAHFQFGLGFSLPWNINFTSDAYENLPLAAQTITTTTTNGKKGKQLKIITTTSQESIGEDNGFLNTLDIPLNGHVTLSGFYNRSLRNKIDTAGFSLTFLLRSAPHGKNEAH